MSQADSLPPFDRLVATRGSALAAALAALDTLAELGETIEDEWTYVTTLADAGRARLRAAAGTDLGTALPPDLAAAVGAVCSETALIADPHRAIDWLSTLPAIVELALGEPAGPEGVPGAGGARGAGATPGAATSDAAGTGA